MNHQLAAILIAAMLVGCKAPAELTTAASTAPEQVTRDSRADAIVPGGESIELRTADGVILEATLWTTGAPGQTTAVFVHQLGSDRWEWAPFIQRIAAPEHEDPPARVIALDLRGHGASVRTESGGALSWQSFTDEDWAKLPLDVAAAVVFARELDPTSTVVLIGSSIGASAVVLYAADDPNIWRTVLLSPGLSYQGLEIADAYAKLEARAAESPFGPAIAAAEADTESWAAAQALSGGEFHFVEGNAHGVAMLDDDPVLLGYVRDVVLAAD